MRKLMTALSITALLGTTSFAMMGCEKDGPAEKAGEKVDEAAEEAKDEIDDAT